MYLRHKVMLDCSFVPLQPVTARKPALLGRIRAARHIASPRLAMFVTMLPA